MNEAMKIISWRQRACGTCTTSLVQSDTEHLKYVCCICCLQRVTGSRQTGGHGKRKASRGVKVLSQADLGVGPNREWVGQDGGV